MTKLGLTKGKDDKEVKKQIIEGKIKTQIDNQAKVTIMSVIHDEMDNYVEIQGSIFHRTEGMINIKEEDIEFNESAKKDTLGFISVKQNAIESMLKIERQIQKRLPQNLRDLEKQKDLESQVESL